MPSLTADDGVRLDYTEYGDPAGRPAVLIAGFKAPATTWRYQVPAFTDAGYRVLAVDLRGHGTSEHPEDGVDMARRGRDVAAVLEGLDLRDVVLVGGSMGANTIWSFLAQSGADRAAAAVSIDQTPKMLNDEGWPFGFYGYDAANRDTYFATGIPETGHGTPMAKRGLRLVRLMTAMKGMNREFTPGELALLHDHAVADWRPTIAAAGIPLLFVAGAESEYWPSGHAAASAALAADATAVVLDDDGHAANMEQPKAFNRAVLEWLAAR